MTSLSLILSNPLSIYMIYWPGAHKRGSRTLEVSRLFCQNQVNTYDTQYNTLLYLWMTMWIVHHTLSAQHTLPLIEHYEHLYQMNTVSTDNGGNTNENAYGHEMRIASFSLAKTQTQMSASSQAIYWKCALNVLEPNIHGWIFTLVKEKISRQFCTNQGPLRFSATQDS